MFMREKCVEHNANAVAAGRILGVDSIEQITSRCIRIVKNIEAELSGPALCRACDFSKSGFGPRTVLLCDQCEKEYHIGRLRTHKMVDLREIPRGKWFCTTDCYRIHSTLQKFLICGLEKLPDSFLDVIKKKHVEKGLGADLNMDVRWRLLSGKFASPHPLKLDCCFLKLLASSIVIEQRSLRESYVMKLNELKVKDKKMSSICEEPVKTFLSNTPTNNENSQGQYLNLVEW
ncbi:hypothetical protein V6N11_076265 [Hibiscus sabdariffa]|uniref:Uncharacterized protein n=1 Tax=Hibiscus sabdariffa TaxID=183260 RepID=A0ABR2Q6B1_9ROSI